ncbi:hypothetical protein QJS10_CPB14g01014 [Acorus calamus]|uniref:Uncharacterized protein n=1 Tax=Acorus calamus TaxID=4465 RepID=A0AAV9DEQ8_ACOCL|nr:hypothetical protein QJS10_CPB14g01014 [Acorus calamus]
MSADFVHEVISACVPPVFPPRSGHGWACIPILPAIQMNIEDRAEFHSIKDTKSCSNYSSVPLGTHLHPLQLNIVKHLAKMSHVRVVLACVFGCSILSNVTDSLASRSSNDAIMNAPDSDRLFYEFALDQSERFPTLKWWIQMQSNLHRVSESSISAGGEAETVVRLKSKFAVKRCREPESDNESEVDETVVESLPVLANFNADDHRTSEFWHDSPGPENLGFGSTVFLSFDLENEVPYQKAVDKLISEGKLADALALSDRCLNEGASDELLQLLVENGEEKKANFVKHQGYGSQNFVNDSWQYCLRLKDKHLAARLALKYLHKWDLDAAMDIFSMCGCHLPQSDPIRYEVLQMRQALLRYSHILSADDRYKCWQEVEADCKEDPEGLALTLAGKGAVSAALEVAESLALSLDLRRELQVLKEFPSLRDNNLILTYSAKAIVSAPKEVYRKRKSSGFAPTERVDRESMSGIQEDRVSVYSTEGQERLPSVSIAEGWVLSGDPIKDDAVRLSHRYESSPDVIPFKALLSLCSDELISSKGAIDLCVAQMKNVLSAQRLPLHASMEIRGQAYYATETFVHSDIWLGPVELLQNLLGSGIVALLDDIADKESSARLRDRLIEDERYNMAIYTCKKSKIYSFPVWNAWGHALIRVEPYAQARVKFKQAFQLYKGDPTPVIPEIINELEGSPPVDVSAVRSMYEHLAKSAPTILDDSLSADSYLNVLYMPSTFPRSERSRQSQEVSNPQYSSNSEFDDGPRSNLDNMRYIECINYFNEYARQLMLGFMFRHGHYIDACMLFFPPDGIPPQPLSLPLASPSSSTQRMDPLATDYGTIDEICDLCVGYGAMGILEDIISARVSMTASQDSAVSQYTASALARICLYCEIHRLFNFLYRFQV